MDQTTSLLRGLADRLREDYFELVFSDAHREFEVHAETRRSLRSRSVEQGLRVWMPFRVPSDTEWLAVRRRPLFKRAWVDAASVSEVEAQARQVLDDWASNTS